MATIADTPSSSGGLTSEVTNAYTQLFGRAPDAAGLQYWSQSLAPGSSQADVNAALLSSAASNPTGADYAAYQKGVTGPGSGANPMGSTTPKLTVQGTSPSGITDPTAYVTSLYQNVLGRTPDVAGENFWINALGKGETQQQVLQDFLNSPEYQANLAKGKQGSLPPSNLPTADKLSTYDPYSQYRGQAAQQLNQLVNNPDIAMSQGGYQAQLQQGITASQRAAAATGQLQSGGEANAISNLAQGQFSTYYNNLFNQLSQLSGANQSPASATAAQNAAQVSSYMAPYQAQSLAANAALSQTNANVAGYMAPYTAAQTQAQTNYITGPQTLLAQSQLQVNDSINALNQANAKSSTINSITGSGGIIGGVAKILGF